MTQTLNAATLAAYEHWAPLYPPMPHNPLMRVEQAAMLELWPETAGRRALDLAAGSGRYSRLLADSQAAEIVAVDFCAPMLAWVSAVSRVCADMMRLPFANCTFDVIISGLALGHASSVHEWMQQAARVLKPGGVLLYSDFHPEAARMSLTRSFSDQDDVTWTVPHHCHAIACPMAAAQAADLTVDKMHEIHVGRELSEPFPNSEEFYEQWNGLPIVLVVRARK